MKHKKTKHKKTTRSASGRTGRCRSLSLQQSPRLAIQVSRAVGLGHRRCNRTVGCRGGTAGRLASASSFATTGRITTASANRSAGGVTTWLASGTNQIIRAMMARAKYASVRYLGDTHLGGLLAATTSGPASLCVRATYLLVVFHLGAAVRFATAAGFATTSWFTTTSVCNTAAGFAATRIATSITTRVVTMSKAKALGAEAERKNDRPENDIPFHRFRLLNSNSLDRSRATYFSYFQFGQPARKALYSLSGNSSQGLSKNI